MKIIPLVEIQDLLNRISIETIIANQESGFVAYSQSKTVVPPVGHLEFLNPPGECHIKYGYITDENIFAIKIANGFYNNFLSGLPNFDGLILVFNSKTGTLKSILLDESYLTNIRTAIAGLIAAKYLAPKNIRGIGIFGTGCQAKLQLQYLKKITNCQNIWVWGRSADRLQAYRQDLELLNLHVQTTTNAENVLQNCNLIVTTTASKLSLFSANLVQPGTHITAVGADAPGKQELDPSIFNQADICVVDSTSQCFEYGDISYALKKNLIPKNKAIELGKVISNPPLGRTNDQQITVADLTGIAVQDIKIATLIDEIIGGKSIELEAKDKTLVSELIHNLTLTTKNLRLLC